jgi:putative CocE/NonD family hydrolase
MSRMRRARPLCPLLLWLLLLLPNLAQAQTFEFKAPPNVDDKATPAVMRDLAERVLPVYQDEDIERYLSTLSTLQLVAGNYPAANDTRQTLLDRRRAMDASRPISRDLLIDLYAAARSSEARGKVPFAEAFTQAYRALVPKLGDLDAYMVSNWLRTPLPAQREPVQKAFDRSRARNSLTQAEALELMRLYLAYDAHRSFGPQAEVLVAEDDAQRYITEENVPIKAPGGARLYARLVRPKAIAKPLPALLEFTIYVSQDEARASAAHGYAGVVAYTRGKNVPASATGNTKKSSSTTLPFQHDGADAAAVIAWIARQPWSDGRVGMIGTGYSGFAAWSAARRMPPALKAIATTDATAPGIDFPTEGRIFRNSALRWIEAHARGDNPAARDDARWSALDLAWYRSGKPYSALERVAKLRSPIFRTWLTHPSYDRYWQKMIPFRQQFAKIDIPVLTTAGYYAGGEIGALYYFSEHLRYRPEADHTLLLGPYEDSLRPAGVLRGYALDAAAMIDLRELRLQWFDHVFRNAAKPALLKDRVNYQLMGSNEWRHAPTLAAMANGSLKFYLDGVSAPSHPRLAANEPANTGYIEQTIKFADRKDAAVPAQPALLARNLALANALLFVSEPLQQPTDLSGLLSGQLDFTTNKMDMDLNLTLYELLPSGEYLQLADPYEFRASYAADRVHRHLLRAGERQQLKFGSEQITSRRLQSGSRLALVLGVNKRPDREINYGSALDVKQASIADTGAPMRIRWYAGSYIEVPVRR